MRHSIRRDVTIMLMAETEAANGFHVIQGRSLIMDAEGQVWIKIEEFAKIYDVYARLMPEVEYVIN